MRGEPPRPLQNVTNPLAYRMMTKTQKAFLMISVLAALIVLLFTTYDIDATAYMWPFSVKYTFGDQAAVGKKQVSKVRRRQRAFVLRGPQAETKVQEEDGKPALMWGTEDLRVSLDRRQLIVELAAISSLTTALVFLCKKRTKEDKT